MPLVRWWETREDASGERVGSRCTLEFAPSRARVVPGDPDEHVVASPFTVTTDETGRVDVHLGVVPAGWAWRVRRVEPGPWWEAWYLVPDVPGPLDFGDLVAVDPGSLEPVAPPSDAWLAALEGVADGIPGAVSEYLAEHPPSAAPDASGTTKGLIRLAGDLGGSADEPTVPGLADKVDTTDPRLSDARPPTAHTHTLDAVSDTAARVAMTPAERTKLAGVAAGATANAADTALRDRATHTGTQAIATVTGLQTALDGKAASLGSDDNYVTDAEKVKLTNLSGTNTGDQTLPTWSTLAGKPAVIGAGADAAAARAAIGAGTSSLMLGTTGSTAAAGNDARLSDSRTPTAHTHAASEITSGTLAAARLPAATETAIGAVELATTAEATTGTDTTRAVTPAGVKAAADARTTSNTKTVKTITAGASVTVSTAYAVNKLTMTQNTTITPSLAANSDPITALHLSGAFVPTWAASIDWPDGAAPTYTSPALYVFLTVDGGTSWVAVQSAKAIA